ncbi:MAG: prepilin-type N-terminal cleavage/methylation domain-containing protein [Peptostreptococcaceae bacterium]|nr:prepilin-type N-terminal cleavage/methylation domain-containing protein [Peptostreptococcaceae bacterium]
MINNDLIIKNNLSYKNKKGLTLVELIIVMGLLVLVVFVAYSFFSASGNFFQKNSDKADAQAQSRLIFQALKIDIGVAKNIKILDRKAGAAVKVVAGQAAYYVNDNVFNKIDGNVGSANTFHGTPINGLSISFTTEGNNVLKVVIAATNLKPLETEFFAPNLTEFDSGGITTSGISGDTIIITKAIGN